MSENDRKKTDPRAKEYSRQLLWSMADTTWRMFVAPAILVPAGIFADLKLGTKPWITIFAAILGMVLSILLVRQQLRGGQ